MVNANLTNRRLPSTHFEIVNMGQAMKAVGVDGCRGGWVAMVWDVEAATIGPENHATLAQLIAAHEDAGAIAVDIPIGLSAHGKRRCDFEARKLLGVSRASSVFPTPIHDAIDARTHAEAVLTSKSLIGKGVSQQSFAMFGRIKEANDTITPEMQDRVFEMHPEVSFHVLAGRPLLHRKSTPEGYEERRVLLERAMGIQLPDRTEAFKWARPAKPDDVLDAAVAAWTARAVIMGEEGRLPAVPEYAESGLRMEMVYGLKPQIEKSGQTTARDTEWTVLEKHGQQNPVREPSIDSNARTNATRARPVPRRGKVPVQGKCFCGCDGDTGKRFCPGHDRRVYSWLEKAEKDGDQDAYDLHRFLLGNDDPSTFAEQHARVRRWRESRG